MFDPILDAASESDQVARTYARFAARETAGVSPVYEEWARGVADDEPIRALIAALPAAKRQPNLVFAASRHAGAPVGPYRSWREWVLAHWESVRPTVTARATQTNEAARCATLLPVLARIEGPLALLELGASAGLCLYPDRYSYRYTGDAPASLDPASGPSPVVLECELRAPAPTRLPEVVWRAGIDRNPLDATDPDARAWLEALVWPGQEYRLERLAAAARIAAADPATLHAGDLNETLAEVAAGAPADATLVVFHSAVLVYLSAADRDRFRGVLADLGCTWVSNEGADVFPDIAARLPQGRDPDGRFVLAVDGEPVALTGPHGHSYTAL